MHTRCWSNLLEDVIKEMVCEHLEQKAVHEEQRQGPSVSLPLRQSCGIIGILGVSDE